MPSHRAKGAFMQADQPASGPVDAGGAQLAALAEPGFFLPTHEATNKLRLARAKSFHLGIFSRGRLPAASPAALGRRASAVPRWVLFIPK